MLLDFTDGSVHIRPELFATRLIVQCFAHQGVGGILRRGGDFVDPDHLQGDDHDGHLTRCRWNIDLNTVVGDDIGDPSDMGRYHYLLDLEGATWRGEGTTDEELAEIHHFSAELTFSVDNPYDPDTPFDVEIRSWYPGASTLTRANTMPTLMTLTDWDAGVRSFRDIGGDGLPPDMAALKSILGVLDQGASILCPPPPRFDRNILDE